jgi:putative nucleotidyltransferase with HDIG domain
MEGVFINKDSSGISLGSEDSQLSLLAKRQDMEVMIQKLPANAVVWIAPAEDRDTMEFFYVLSGAVDLMLDKGPAHIPTGGCFHVEGLTKDVYIRTEQDSKLLYLTNKPMFDNVFGFQGNLNELMQKVDDKDHYTYRHCRNVMDYSVALLRRISVDRASLDALVTAALFHDIGKCFVPDEILKKPDKLTPGEFKVMMKHPTYSARLLSSRFGPKVAEIARSHHERLDGSGYPFGLSGDDISLEGKIIAVADSFDAMTTSRPYRPKPKGYREAAEELCSLDRLYDAGICRLLRSMVESGDLFQEIPS